MRLHIHGDDLRLICGHVAPAGTAVEAIESECHPTIVLCPVEGCATWSELRNMCTDREESA